MNDGLTPASDVAPSRNPRLLWMIGGSVTLVLVSVVGWVALQAAGRAAAAKHVAAAHVALDKRDTATAHDRIVRAARQDPERSDLVFARGRLAQATQNHALALTLLRRSETLADDEGWDTMTRGKVARLLADAEVQAGQLDRALRVNDSGLARLSDALDSHFDQDGLDARGRPAGGAAATLAPDVAEGLALLAQRGRIAARRAEALHKQGDDATAKQILAAAETRISGTICTGTHRVYCRGPRASLREATLAPCRAMRTRLRIDAALALIDKQAFDEALELAAEAHEQAAAAAKNAPQQPPGPGAEASVNSAAQVMARDAIRVEYAVRVAWGQQLEKQKKWGDATTQFEKADALWKEGRLGASDQPDAVQREGGKAPHEAGLLRARTLHKLLDDTDSTLDKAAKLMAPLGTDLGLGDAARKRFHDKLEAAPLDPKIYAEEALSRIRTARVSNSDSVDVRKAEAEAQRFLTASEHVVPGDPMGQFYKGVLAFMAGYPKKGLDGMRSAYKAGYSGRAAELYLAETLSLRDKHAEALTHWKRAWQAETTDTYVGRRTVEALVARGELAAAGKLVAQMLEERTLDRDLIEAQVLLFLHTKDYDSLRRVLLADRVSFSATTPDAVQRTQRITEAMYNKLGARARTDVLQPGEELIDRLYGYAIPAEGEKLAAEKRVQSAILVLTTRGLVVLRWDATKDYRKEIERGARLVQRATRVGVRLGGEFAGLHLGDGIGKLAQLLDLLPEAKTREKAPKKESLLDSTVGLAIDSLDLFDTLRGDLELQVQGAAIAVHRIGRGTVVAWELLPVDPAKGLYAIHARTRDGLSPWHTDGDRLLVHTARPARLRMYLQHVLQQRPPK